MRPLATDEILLSRIQLLLIMAKAFLRGYPLGDDRKTALAQNAQSVFYEILHRTAGKNSSSLGGALLADRDAGGQQEHFFLQRVQLLAVMVKSIAAGQPMEDYRRQAVSDNVARIGAFLCNQLHVADVHFLKVA